MLSERRYLRGNPPPGESTVVTWLVSILVGAYAVQLSLGSGWLPRSVFSPEYLGIAADRFDVASGWKLAVFWLLHSPANLLHLAVVVAAVLFVGRPLLQHIPAARLVGLFVVANTAGALVWFACRQGSGEILVGSSAGALALLTLFASIYPDREYRLLLFFAFPATFRPRQLAAAVLAVDLAAVLIVDVLGRALPFDLAAPGHLAGALAGWAYYQFVYERRSAPREIPAPELEPEAAMAPKSPALAESAGRKPARTVPADDFRARVDGVLDKISSQGMASLTPAERRLLDEARSRLGHPR